MLYCKLTWDGSLGSPGSTSTDWIRSLREQRQNTDQSSLLDFLAFVGGKGWWFGEGRFVPDTGDGGWLFLIAVRAAGDGFPGPGCGGAGFATAGFAAAATDAGGLAGAACFASGAGAADMVGAGTATVGSRSSSGLSLLTSADRFDTAASFS